MNSFEGVEGQRIDISGGTMDMYCIDDGINAESNNKNPDVSDVSLDEVQEGTVTLNDSEGTVLVDFQPAKEYSSVLISLPELEIGETYTLTAVNHSENITMGSFQYGGGMSMMGGMKWDRTGQ